MPCSRSLIFIVAAKGFWRDVANGSQKIVKYSILLLNTTCMYAPSMEKYIKHEKECSSEFQSPRSGLKKHAELSF